MGDDDYVVDDDNEVYGFVYCSTIFHLHQDDERMIVPCNEASHLFGTESILSVAFDPAAGACSELGRSITAPLP